MVETELKLEVTVDLTAAGEEVDNAEETASADDDETLADDPDPPTTNRYKTRRSSR